MRRLARALGVGFGLVSGLAFMCAVAGAGSVDTAAAAGLPPLELSTSTLSPGGTATIIGHDYPAHRVLQAVVCGGGPLAVSSECDLPHAIGFGSADNGVVQASLVVAFPPAPCPCVVLVTQQNTSATEALPIIIKGAPSAPLPAQPPPVRPAVTVSRVHVVSDDLWTTWFGAAAARELVLTVHNGSSNPVRALLVAHWVRGSDNYVITSPRPRVLRPGETEDVTAPFVLSTFSHGQFAVIGNVTGAGFEDRLATSTSTMPWALYALLIIFAIGVLLAVAAVIGRRRNGGGDADPSSHDFNDEPRAQLTLTGAAQ